MSERTLEVSDILADRAGVSRTHTLLDATGAAHDFTFVAGQRTAVPFGMAFGLVANPGFAVYDDKSGRRIKADPARSAMAKLDLKPDETVANLEELTREALLARARRLPGGETLAPGTAKHDVVLFVMAGGVQAERDIGDLDEPALQVNERIAA